MANKELLKFYQSLNQDIKAIQLSEDEGGNSEQVFTQIALDNLAEAGETENVILAFDKKDIGSKNQHQINAYSSSDNFETIDLFITVYKGTEEISKITQSDIITAQKRISNFFKKCINKNYVNDIEESSEIFQLAYTLAELQKTDTNGTRVTAFILTDGEYNGEFPKSEIIDEFKILYRIVDIGYFFKISEESRVPIEVNFEDFEGEKYKIPCLTANTHSNKYETYIAIMPGGCISKLYDRFGARLLEQNVRSFLQFNGKINRGIRDTIRNESEMFLAFNNGIAATADHIELDSTGHFISKISNLQIVNGGQTTATIYNSEKNEKADISRIYVQVKFSVIKNPEDFSEIVSRISKYANTQNKINDADFSANNPALITFEKLSRYILSPASSVNLMQTCWFFERARGQYKTLRSREGRTKSLQAAFDRKYPQKQMFTKVELAKYINAYQEIYDGKKLLIGPHIVVRGNEKNYAQFIANNLPSEIKKINSVYFEDSIAKCLLFKNAEKRYGVKPNNIGEMRQVVVPYTLSLFNILTNNKIDLYKIWKNQEVSNELSECIFNLMVQVNKFISVAYSGKNYIQTAKGEECWESVKKNNWNLNVTLISSDLIDDKNPPKRKTDINIEEEEHNQNKKIVKSIPVALWNEILQWGKETSNLDTVKQVILSNLAFKLRENKPIDNDVYKVGVEILDIVAKQNEEILLKAEEYTGKLVRLEKPKITDEQKDQLILGLIKKMIAFNLEINVLSQDESDMLYDIVNGNEDNDELAMIEVNKCLVKLGKKGFNPN